MNKINRKVEYALIALKHMRAKAPGELTTAKEVCAQYGSPFDATARALQVLAQKGVLKSEQGAYGGYAITRDLGRVSFYELMEMILGPVAVAKCVHETGAPCEIRGTCNIVSPVQALNRKLVEFYRSLSVGELLGAGSRSPAPAKEARPEQGSANRSEMKPDAARHAGGELSMDSAKAASGRSARGAFKPSAGVEAAIAQAAVNLSIAESMPAARAAGADGNGERRE